MAVADAQAYGTAGALVLREEFDSVSTLLDAFYLSLVTGSTVGYGDVTPTTAVGKLFALSVVLVMVSSFAAVLGVVFTLLIEARLSKALGYTTEEQLDTLENHVLVLGHGDLTEPILEETAAKAEVLVVVPDEGRARRLSVAGSRPHGRSSRPRATTPRTPSSGGRHPGVTLPLARHRCRSRVSARGCSGRS